LSTIVVAVVAVVAVDVGESSAMLSAAGSAGAGVCGPVEFVMTRSGLAAGIG
jgi:hypothetical protein